AGILEMTAYRIICTLTKLLLWTQMRLRVAGAERVPSSGPMLLVSNHLGPADHFIIGVRLRRQMRILAKIEIFHWPIVGWIAHRAGAVPIRRGESDRDALRIAVRLLEAGECMLVFPEGTYAHAPEPVGMLPVKTGAAWLALRSDALVVPVAISGSESVWMTKRGWRLGKRPRVVLTYGEPYRPTVPHGGSRRAALDAVADEMARHIAALLPAAYRGAYADAPVERPVRHEISAVN
ncbi:MAG TPA: lysophospholipid acyltransferase family protein, partial [Ktedonobacterales bacterium]|nr:lysophospholipid acyltransferase family protein [Ktedonobacterales bacterium]